MVQSLEKCLTVIEKVIFSNSSNGFCIFSGRPVKEKNTFIAKGYLGDITDGDELLLWGDWVKHPKYGMQVNITRFEYPKTETKDILAFLQSGFVKGVGPSLAKRIVKKFGEDTVHVFDNEPKRLLEVSGIGPKTWPKIVESWQREKGKREAIIQFQEWGIGPASIQKILKKIENPIEAIEKVQTNPYWLAWEIKGIGFLIADKIAQNIGFALDDPFRIQAGLYYCLDDASAKDGHCYLPEEELIKKAKEILFPEQNTGQREIELIQQGIKDLCKARRLIMDEDRVYTALLYNTEQRLASNIQRLLGGVKDIPFDIDAMIDQYESDNKIKLHTQQREAVRAALENKVAIITGGPGTGKTTIVNAILTLARQAGLKKFGLVSPTGRAAKRLSESTGMETSTIHRFLEFHPEYGFQRNEENPVKSELVICDESSMLDVYLAKALTSALKNSARLVFVGDVYQLPSVGAGNVLKDLISSGQVPVVELTKIFRQSEGSWIALNAFAVKQGKIKDINLSNKTEDFFWFDITRGQELTPAQKVELVQMQILDIVRRLLRKGYKESDIQILTPMYKGQAGVQVLNQELQNIFNPRGQKFRIGFTEYRVGDRVMQIRNNYDKEVFNGDQGYIVRYEKDAGIVYVDFQGDVKDYSIHEMDEIVLAYAITVHKSQGSEYPVVIQPVTTSHFIMLQRNLLYTGITRAKQICVLVGEKKALAIAVRNNKVTKRYTKLSLLINHPSMN
jgi:exodeoxyribonuclease V alpha subunit